MGMIIKFHKPVVAASILALSVFLPVDLWAKPAPELLAELKTAENVTAADHVVRELRLEWGKSGSAAMDLLLKRGRAAMAAKDLRAAIEHFTALTDHAPGFAEGWHGRASAYFRSGMYGPAVADLEQVLALNPSHFEAIQGLAVILEKLDRFDDAYAAYQLVLALHPHHDEAIEAVKRLGQLVKGQKL